MKVYILEIASYDDRYIAGVYTSLEHVINAYDIGFWQQISSETWDDQVCWSNGLMGDHAGLITEYELNQTRLIVD